MFVVSKRNIVLRSADGSQAYPVAKGYIGEIPDWAAETEYFRDLVRDGKLGVPESSRDAAVENKAETPVRQRKSEE